MKKRSSRACIASAPRRSASGRGVGDVAEEHGDLLAFPLDRAPQRKDLVGEVLRGVALWGRELRRRYGLAQRRSALPTESVSRGIRCAAGCADGCQRGSTLPTKSRPGGILVPAPGALHARSYRPPDVRSRQLAPKCGEGQGRMSRKTSPYFSGDRAPDLLGRERHVNVANADDRAPPPACRRPAGYRPTRGGLDIEYRRRRISAGSRRGRPARRRSTYGARRRRIRSWRPA